MFINQKNETQTSEIFSILKKSQGTWFHYLFEIQKNNHHVHNQINQ